MLLLLFIPVYIKDHFVTGGDEAQEELMEKADVVCADIKLKANNDFDDPSN